MNDDLSPRCEITRACMSVEVSREEQYLERHEARIPYGRRAPQERQHEPREEGLDPEEEKCADEGCKREYDDQWDP